MSTKNKGCFLQLVNVAALDPALISDSTVEKLNEPLICTVLLSQASSLV